MALKSEAAIEIVLVNIDLLVVDSKNNKKVEQATVDGKTNLAIIFKVKIRFKVVNGNKILVEVSNLNYIQEKGENGLFLEENFVVPIKAVRNIGKLLVNMVVHLVVEILGIEVVLEVRGIIANFIVQKVEAYIRGNVKDVD